jgi:hypothetical protein
MINRNSQRIRSDRQLKPISEELMHVCFDMDRSDVDFLKGCLSISRDHPADAFYVTPSHEQLLKAGWKGSFDDLQEVAARFSEPHPIPLNPHETFAFAIFSEHRVLTVKRGAFLRFSDEFLKIRSDFEAIMDHRIHIARQGVVSKNALFLITSILIADEITSSMTFTARELKNCLKITNEARGNNDLLALMYDYLLPATTEINASGVPLRIFTRVLGAEAGREPRFELSWEIKGDLSTYRPRGLLLN